MSKVPYPKTKFLKVKCPGCNNEQTVFSAVKMEVKCNVCDGVIATPRGGNAKILGEIIEKHA